MSIDFNYNEEILNKSCFYEKILTYIENILLYYAFMRFLCIKIQHISARFCAETQIQWTTFLGGDRFPFMDIEM